MAMWTDIDKQQPGNEEEVLFFFVGDFVLNGSWDVADQEAKTDIPIAYGKPTHWMPFTHPSKSVNVVHLKFEEPITIRFLRIYAANHSAAYAEAEKMTDEETVYLTGRVDKISERTYDVYWELHK